MRLPVLLLASMLGISTAYAEVFRYTDDDGNVVYTDELREGAEKVEIREVPTINMPDGPLTEDNLNRAQEETSTLESTGYQRLFFAEPENNSAFWSGSGNIVLAVEALPELKNNHRYEVLLDGQSLGRNNSGIFNVQHINRGTHTATVRIMSENGNTLSATDDVIQTGQSITFTVHRPSVQN